MPKTIHRGVIIRLRRIYCETWNRGWPHNDSYLAELWLEARGDAANAKNHTILKKIYADTLTLMRESHDF